MTTSEMIKEVNCILAGELNIDDFVNDMTGEYDDISLGDMDNPSFIYGGYDF